jgi:Ribosomal protein L7/L12 C-terminal domain
MAEGGYLYLNPAKAQWLSKLLKQVRDGTNLTHDSDMAVAILNDWPHHLDSEAPPTFPSDHPFAGINVAFESPFKDWDEPTPEFIDCLMDASGSKIAAIKNVRTLYSCGLMEAKEAVDKWWHYSPWASPNAYKEAKGASYTDPFAPLF